jgi:dTDP-4-amino-4,6-dideoxy-D-galactose acyltransferase
MKIQPLPWDSEFFGINTARVHLQHANELDCQLLDDYGLVYIFSEEELDGKANCGDISLQDRKVVYSMKLHGKSATMPPTIHAYQKDSMESMIRLGKKSGIYSRFLNDKRFGEGKFEELYSTWVKRSLNKEIADEVFVYRDETNEPRGFVSVKINGNKAVIGLLSVDEGTRGMGIGKALIDATIDYSKKEHAEYLEVATQKNNTSACAFYEKCGFSVKSEQYVYHFWNNKSLN